MANAKITGLTANTAPADADIMPMVDDPGGSPLTQKITMADLKAYFLDIATAAIWDAAGDLIQGTGANAGARLAIGTAYQYLGVNAAANAAAWAGGLTGWTPTITQGSAVTKTVNYAQYLRIGSLCWVCASLTFTGTGTTANNIVVTDFPVAIAADGVYGTGIFFNAGTAYYTGGMRAISGAGYLYCHLETDGIGADPNFAIAVNDLFWFSMMYPV